MRARNRANLRVVEPNKDPTDEIIDRIMDELRDEDAPLEALDQRIAKQRKKFHIRVAILAVLVIAAAASVYLLLTLPTYEHIRTINTYQTKDSNNGTYIQFYKGVLKYSRDGVIFLNQRGEEQWNQACQLKNPDASVSANSAAVYDGGGNTILVFGEDGLKGEISTTLPIQRLSISDQGIVAAVLKDESTPRVICYDAQGNILVEHKASTTGTGYPIGISLSPDGNLLLITYLYIQNNEIATNVSYLNFGKVGQDETDHQVAKAQYDQAIMPMTFFVNNETSVIVGDQNFLIYKGDQIPEPAHHVKLKGTIKSAFHNEKYLGLVLQNEGAEGYELRLYNMDGKEVTSVTFKGEYDNIKLSGNLIMMYEGKRCCVFTKSGRLRFDGEMNSEILEMFPINGINKYLVMSANGMEEVRFVK